VIVELLVRKLSSPARERGFLRAKTSTPPLFSFYSRVLTVHRIKDCAFVVSGKETEISSVVIQRLWRPNVTRQIRPSPSLTQASDSDVFLPKRHIILVTETEALLS
jgi:hypothetical protein